MDRKTAKRYYQLTKPGVLYGNVITGAAGFFLASGHLGYFDTGLFVATILGMTLVIASACVLNNVLDQDIDRIMERTRRRAVASGEVSRRSAVVLSLVLGLVGVIVLMVWTGWRVVSIGVVGYVIYVWLYGAFSKRRSAHGTLVGSVSGAMPILAGYVAVAGRFDLAALMLFLTLFFWQFPEFYSIAIYRRQEYAKARIPLMSVVKGVNSTTIQIFAYTVLFVASSVALTPLGYTGWVYFVVMLLMGLYWIGLGWRGLRCRSKDAWAHEMFHFSLVMLLVLSVMLSLGALLP